MINMRAAKTIPLQIAVTVQYVNAALHEFIKDATNKSASFINGASNTAEDASEHTLSTLSSFEDEVKAPLCMILECVNPITFQFHCHCSVIAESFKAIPDAGTAVSTIGLSQQFVYDLLECCPEVGTTDTQFLMCMIGCDDQENDEAVSESTLCKIANCKIPQALGFSNDNIDAVTTSCCPGGEQLGTFACFDAMGDSGLIDTEKWRNVQLEGMGTGQADIFCSDGSGLERVMGTSSVGDQMLSPAVLIVAFTICVHGHHFI